MMVQTRAFPMISTMASIVIAVVKATPNAMIDEFLFRNLNKKKDN